MADAETQIRDWKQRRTLARLGARIRVPIFAFWLSRAYGMPTVRATVQRRAGRAAIMDAGRGRVGSPPDPDTGLADFGKMIFILKNITSI